VDIVHDAERHSVYRLERSAFQVHMLMGGLRHIVGTGLEQLVCQVVKSSAGRQFVADLRDIFVTRA
jgi:hypothetical protein